MSGAVKRGVAWRGGANGLVRVWRGFWGDVWNAWSAESGFRARVVEREGR